MPDEEWQRTQSELDKAYRTGDLAKIRSLSPDPDAFPNHQAVGPLGVGEIPLEYAIYHSPLATIAALLEMGADPNYGDHAGFPSLIAALSSERSDLPEILAMLLEAGADIQQRGVNDWTPLHWAANAGQLTQVQFLLDHGADPNARTAIDDHTTPLDEAEAAGRTEVVDLLRPVTD